jgi:hypothetical protein
MARTVIITDHELSILCDLTGGWGAKWDSEDKHLLLAG